MKNNIVEQIRHLIDLHKVDDEIVSEHKNLAEAPLEVKALKVRLDRLTIQRNNIQERINHLQEQQKRLEHEIAEDAERLNKSRNKSMQVEDSRAQNAIEREINTMENLRITREEEKKALKEEIQRQQGEFESVNEDYEPLFKEFEEKNAGLEVRLQTCKDRLAELAKERELATKEISAHILNRYDFIRMRLEHPVIVPVHETVCSGCYMAMPQQEFIKLKRTEEILSCPNCQRLVYPDTLDLKGLIDPILPSNKDMINDDTGEDEDEVQENLELESDNLDSENLDSDKEA